MKLQFYKNIRSVSGFEERMFSNWLNKKSWLHLLKMIFPFFYLFHSSSSFRLMALELYFVNEITLFIAHLTLYSTYSLLLSVVRFMPIKPPSITLKKLRFEVPHMDNPSVFVGREWLFNQLLQVKH